MNKQLWRILSQLRSVAVAYSGGTDSSYLLANCLEVLGPDAVLAITVDSPLIPRADLAAAQALASEMGARHILLAAEELDNPQIAANPPDRCYHCKRARFEALRTVAQAEGLAHLLHGENADDAGDYRPGSRAAEELGVRAPLREAGLGKDEIRALSRRMGLPTWDKSADACLATRFPYGTQLTAKGLARVEAAETALRAIWELRQVRVRDHYPVARVEVLPHEIGRLAQSEVRSAAARALKKLGYRYVTLDLDGYRLGSMNDELEPQERDRPGKA
jgi:pyridinium-3,5-biscarboxylic acid mononucleotide sulfurtransferase